MRLIWTVYTNDAKAGPEMALQTCQLACAMMVAKTRADQSFLFCGARSRKESGLVLDVESQSVAISCTLLCGAHYAAMCL